MCAARFSGFKGLGSCLRRSIASARLGAGGELIERPDVSGPPNDYMRVTTNMEIQ